VARPLLHHFLGLYMLFLYQNEDIRHFWMRNTLIPLDMIFISADLRVVGIVENAEPQTETIRQVPQPSQYVLEVNGGYAAAHGIAAGTPVEFRDIEWKRGYRPDHRTLALPPPASSPV